MILALITRFWPYILSALGFLIIAWVVLGWRDDSKQLSITNEQLAICRATIAENEKQIEKEKEQANEYYEKLDAVERDYNAATKRLRETRCICPVSKPSSACNAQASTTGELHKENGITTESLFDFARDAERVRQQLLACQKWAGDLI